jgi:hypothetical protein
VITLIIAVAVIVAIALAVKLAQGTARSAVQNAHQQQALRRPPSTRPGGARPASKRPRPAPSRPGSARRGSAAATPAPAQTPKQVRVVLQRQLGQAYADEQERVRLRVRQQEQKVTARLTGALRLLDFDELKALHTESRQTADHAYRLMDQARKAENELWSSIKQTYQARDTSGTRGANRDKYTHTANELHQEKDVVHNHFVQFKAEVDRLNQNTGRLRDSINANCGERGQEWYRALMARTAARREGRM